MVLRNICYIVSTHLVREVLTRYTEITPGVQLSGPTSFAPIIDKAIQIVSKTRAYHILIMCKTTC